MSAVMRINSQPLMVLASANWLGVLNSHSTALSDSRIHRLATAA